MSQVSSRLQWVVFQRDKLGPIMVFFAVTRALLLKASLHVPNS